MTRLTAAVSILLVGVLIVAGDAQAQRRGMMARADSAQGPQMDMMQDGMMGPNMMAMMQGMQHQMMQNPMHRAHIMAFSLPSLADTLSLSEAQVRELEDMKTDMMAQRQVHREQMQGQRTELMGRFEADASPPAAVVRKHLRAMGELRADHQAAMYSAAQSMRAVLTDEQRQKLDSLSPQQYINQMMARMPMRDMMQMMQSGRGGMMGNCPMQKAPMMGRGMGPGGGMGMRQSNPRTP